MRAHCLFVRRSPENISCRLVNVSGVWFPLIQFILYSLPQPKNIAYLPCSAHTLQQPLNGLLSYSYTPRTLPFGHHTIHAVGRYFLCCCHCWFRRARIRIWVFSHICHRNDGPPLNMWWCTFILCSIAVRHSGRLCTNARTPHTKHKAHRTQNWQLQCCALPVKLCKMIYLSHLSHCFRFTQIFIFSKSRIRNALTPVHVDGGVSGSGIIRFSLSFCWFVVGKIFVSLEINFAATAQICQTITIRTKTKKENMRRLRAHTIGGI